MPLPRGGDKDALRINPGSTARLSTPWPLGREIFASCSLSASPVTSKGCSRCHSVGMNVQKEYDYASFTEKLPKENAWSLVDWEDAEARGVIQPIDFLPGISVERPPLTVQKDFSITSSGWMSDIIFSQEACPLERLRSLSSGYLSKRQEGHSKVFNVPDIWRTVLRCLPRSRCFSFE